MGIQSSAEQEYGHGNHGFQNAINSRIIENMWMTSKFNGALTGL